ncbi:MAG: glutathione S-transferase N-terminal domain-containing protein [Chromatiales bacterium]|nr:glutathione S-transferase N-terminal domain-containing protein [Chromatiales bacterium]
MAVVTNKRSVMTLFSDSVCPRSHAVRFVLAEKNVTFEVVDVDPDNKPEDLIDLNPYNSVPTLVDRDLVLYNARVVMEYLDERFPHPPLLPVDPVNRARARLYVHRIEYDWYTLVDELGSSDKKAAKARKQLRESLLATAPIFDAKPFFMSDEFSLVDCWMAPILWRLPSYGIELPNQARALQEYGARLFAMESFRASLTEAEKDIRDRAA